MKTNQSRRSFLSTLIAPLCIGAFILATSVSQAADAKEALQVKRVNKNRVDIWNTSSVHTINATIKYTLLNQKPVTTTMQFKPSEQKKAIESTTNVLEVEVVSASFN